MLAHESCLRIGTYGRDCAQAQEKTSAQGQRRYFPGVDISILSAQLISPFTPLDHRVQQGRNGANEGRLQGSHDGRQT